MVLKEFIMLEITKKFQKERVVTPNLEPYLYQGLDSATLFALLPKDKTYSLQNIQNALEELLAEKRIIRSSDPRCYILNLGA